MEINIQINTSRKKQSNLGIMIWRRMLISFLSGMIREKREQNNLWKKTMRRGIQGITIIFSSMDQLSIRARSTNFWKWNNYRKNTNIFKKGKAMMMKITLCSCWGKVTRYRYIHLPKILLNKINLSPSKAMDKASIAMSCSIGSF